jgi:hypothetical protein
VKYEVSLPCRNRAMSSASENLPDLLTRAAVTVETD